MSLRPEDAELIQRHNLEDRQRLEDRVVELRTELIRSAFQGLKLYFMAQQDAIRELVEQGYPERATIDFYVLDDEVGLPFTTEPEPKPQRSLSLLVAPKVYHEGLDELDTEKPPLPHMKVHIPIDDALVLDPENFDIDSFAEPTWAVFERVSDKGLSSSYIVKTDGQEPFIQATQDTASVRLEDTPSDDDWSVLDLSVQFDSGLAVIAEVQQDLTNWHAYVQRRALITKPGTPPISPN